MVRLSRSLQLAFAFALLGSLLGSLRPANAAQNFLPPIGGSGGGQFLAPCPEGQDLTGFELRAGDDIDAIRALCVTAYSTGSVTAPQLTNGSGLIQQYTNGTRELEGAPYAPLAGDYWTLPADWHGGTGGGRASVICPHERPIVVAVDVVAEGVRTITVNNIHLYCGLAQASQQLDANPSAIFDAPRASGSPAVLGIGGTSVSTTHAFQRCPDGQVAVGMHGRSGEWVDAVGLICDAPRVTHAMALGRVQSPSGTPAPAMSICDTARSARARNSPAAPGLEAQCEAQSHRKTGMALGRVQGSAPKDGPPVSICDAAISAHMRNSPSAPGLEQRCRALGGGAALDRAFGVADPDALAANGADIAAGDALLSSLRQLQPEGGNRRGFDIGVAAGGGDTAWGPGKQRILDSLAATEQEGFKVAMSFVLDRNRNAQLASTGAAIDIADPELAQARAADVDSRYALGFDIATGLFGDPALGAAGNTVLGPGSLAIRNGLGAAAQRGFDAAVTLHQGRKY